MSQAAKQICYLSTHAQYILSTKVTTNQRQMPHVVPMVQWNGLYLIRTSNQWFHHHKEPTNMYNKGAGTFVCLELLVRVMSWMPSMEGRSCCCCSRPNQIQVVHCTPCKPSIHPSIPSIYNQVFAQKVQTVHCRHCSRE